MLSGLRSLNLFSATGDEATPIPEDKKVKTTLLEKAAGQSGRHGRGASGTPAKKARNAGTASDPNTTPIAAGSSHMAVEESSDATPVPAIKLEPGLTIHVPPPASLTSGIMTPTAVAPQLPASNDNSRTYSHTDLWRHALKKKKGNAANLVARLVPASEGVAEPESERQDFLSVFAEVVEIKLTSFTFQSIK